MIPQEAVEAAAKAWHLSRWPDAPWDLLNDESRNYGRTHIRAAPHRLATQRGVERRGLFAGRFAVFNRCAFL